MRDLQQLLPLLLRDFCTEDEDASVDANKHSTKQANPLGWGHDCVVFINYIGGGDGDCGND